MPKFKESILFHQSKTTKISEERRSCPPVTEPSDSKYEKWLINALPDKWTTVSRKSEIIDKFNAHLREKYDNCIKELGSHLSTVNLEIETDIRLKSSVLKHDLQETKNAGLETVNALQEAETKVLDFDEEKFQTAKQYCIELQQKGKIKLVEFHEFLQYIEKYRSGKFKEILRASYKKLQECYCKLPYEIQTFFEEQILHINQILLNNLRGYNELLFNLRQVLNNDIKLLLYKITTYEEKWKELCMAEIIRRLKEYDLKYEEIQELLFKDKTIMEIIKLFKEKISLMLQSIDGGLVSDKSKAEEWYKRIRKCLSDLDTSAKQLIELYKSAVLKLCSELHTELESTSVRVIGGGQETKEYKNFKEEFVQPEVYDEKMTIQNEIEDLQNRWDGTVNSMLKRVRATHKCLKQLSQIWETHNKRLEEVQNLLIIDLDNAFADNDKLLQGKQEIDLNVAIDTLRQEFNEKKLQKTLNKVSKLLGNIKKLIASQKENELKVVNKYYGFVQQETELLVAELTQFVQKYEATEEEVFERYMDFKNNNDFVIYVELTKCETYLLGVDNWKTQLLESIKQLIESCPEDQQKVASVWTTPLVEKVTNRFESKISFHQMRFERIKLEVHDVRLAELRKHQQRLESHKSDVDKNIIKLTTHVKLFQENQQTTVQDSLRQLLDMSERSKECLTYAHAALCLYDATAFVDKETIRVTESYNNMREQIQAQVDEILRSNYNFLQSIKLFSEGGNFHPKEAAATSKKLMQIEINIQKKTTYKAELTAKEKNVLKDIKNTSTKYISTLNYVSTILKFHENSIRLYNNVIDNIKDEVYVMKSKMQYINGISEKIRISSEQNRTDASRVQLIINYTKAMIESCEEFKNYLQDTDEQLKITPLVDELMWDAATTTSKATSKSKRRVGKKEPEFTDFRTKLFAGGSPNQDACQFMPKICKIIYNCLSDMQTLANEYYTAHISISLINIVVPLTYDEYMAIALYKLKFYYLQCADVWVKQIQEFARLLNDFPLYVHKFCDKYLDVSHSEQMKKTNNNHATFSNKAEELNTAHKQKLTGIRNELKPLHGYPGNSYLLLELENKMKDVMAMVKEEFEEFFKPFEDTQQEYVHQYVEKVLETKNTTDELKSILVPYDFCSKMIDQAIDLVMYLSAQNGDVSIKGSLISVDKRIEDSSIYLLNEDALTNFPILIDYRAKLSELKSNARRSSLELKQKDFEQADKMTKIFEEVINSNRVKIVEFQEKFHGELSTFKDIWEADTNRVRNLYKLKYP